MTTGRETQAMISGMAPRLMAGDYVFVGSADPAQRDRAIASFQEAEGLSLILPAEAMPEAGPRMRLITLEVQSSLEGVGLTAAVSTALARDSIPCNIVAAFHHDHVFVPADMADRALAVLEALSRSA